MSVTLSFAAPNSVNTVCMLGSSCQLTCTHFWNRVWLADESRLASRVFPQEMKRDSRSGWRAFLAG